MGQSLRRCSLENCSELNSRVISPKVRRICISKMLRSSKRLGAPGVARELDHGLVAVEERQARQLAPVATAWPLLSLGAQAKRTMLGDRLFSLKLNFPRTAAERRETSDRKRFIFAKLVTKK
jgi:hypothetical protein